jgi:hypothetical protein
LIVAPETRDDSGAGLFLAAFGLTVAGLVTWVLWPAAKASKSASGPGSEPQVDFSKARLHFINSFPDAKYLGISFPGLCGGMAFTALDYWWSGIDAPTTTTTPSTETDWLGQYIHARQALSLLGDMADNGTRFLALLANPSDGALGDVSAAEFEVIRSAIDSGYPVPLGLIPAPWAPLAVTSAHQVVAIGYDEDEWGKTVFIWDPNHPMSDRQLLRQPLGQTWWFEFGDGSKDQWRGLFVTNYEIMTPPAPSQAVA